MNRWRTQDSQGNESTLYDTEIVGTHYVCQTKSANTMNEL